jgi:hypothetical protein
MLLSELEASLEAKVIAKFLKVVNPQIRDLCAPSQYGGFLVCLHVQKNFFSVSGAANFSGTNVVGLCEPSQNGCLALSPQLHQA